METTIIDTFEKLDYVTKITKENLTEKLGFVPDNFEMHFKIKEKERMQLVDFLELKKIRYQRTTKKFLFRLKSFRFSRGFITVFINGIHVDIFNTWVYKSQLKFNHIGNGKYECKIKVDLPERKGEN